MPGESVEQKKVERFPCPSCSAGMEFDPASGKMKCAYCGHTEAPPAVGPIPSHSYLEAGDNAAALATVSPEAQEVRCNGCGSIVAFRPPEVAGTCSFCGSAVVAQPKAADPMLAPDGVLPARVDKKKAQTEVQGWLQTRWFAPNALKKIAHQEGINGVYLPFWTYDCETFSRYTGERGEYYYTTETYEESDGKGGYVTRTREVRHTRWYSASGSVRDNFLNVLVAATQSVASDRLKKLSPWGLDGLRPYEPAFLAGFKAQRYQVQLRDGFEAAKRAMQPTIESDIRSDIGGDEQRINTVETEYSNVMFRHLLLPVWIGAYRYKNESFQVLVNASTGEVTGERPYSSVKILLLTLVIFLLILAGFFLYNQSQQSSTITPVAPVTQPVVEQPQAPAAPQTKKKTGVHKKKTQPRVQPRTDEN